MSIKFLVLVGGGGYFGFWGGGGGSADFIFMGARIFLIHACNDFEKDGICVLEVFLGCIRWLWRLCILYWGRMILTLPTMEAKSAGSLFSTILATSSSLKLSQRFRPRSYIIIKDTKIAHRRSLATFIADEGIAGNSAARIIFTALRAKGTLISEPRFSTPCEMRFFPRERGETAFFKEKPSTKAVFPFSRGKNRISQGVENRGSLISVPLALRAVFIAEKIAVR